MDSYEVEYEYQKPDGFWGRKIEVIHVDGKDKHHEVEKIIEKKYNNMHKKYSNVNIIRITYQ